MDYISPSPYSLKPWLSLPQLCTLLPLASPVLSLILVAFRLNASSAVAQESINDAKNTLAASCLSAQKAAAVGVNIPRFLAQGTNTQITEAVRGTMEGTRIALTLSLSAVEGIIEFMVDLYRSTFLCFLELVIRGGLAVLAAAVGEITDFVNSFLGDAAGTIATQLNGALGGIRDAIQAINNSPLPLPDIPVPNINFDPNQFSNIQLPNTAEQAINDLSNKIPTLDSLRQMVDDLISKPFNLLKAEINSTFIEAQNSFNANPLPVPKEASITFCDELDYSIIDDVAKSLAGLARTGILILAGLALLLMIAHAGLTYSSRRTARAQISLVIERMASRHGEMNEEDGQRFHGVVAHPLWTKFANWVTVKFRLTQEPSDAVHWFGAYIFHRYAIACLMIGGSGLMAVQVQLMAARPLQAKFSDAIANTIDDFSVTIARSFNETMGKDSAEYAQTLNLRIAEMETSINTDLFGWVNGTTNQLNQTLNAFYDDISDAVDTVFGGTPLSAATQTFLQCILGSKIDAIEKAITFLQDNLVVSIPRVDEDALMLSKASVDDVANRISAAAVGEGGEGNGGVVGRIIDRYIKSLEQDRFMFLIFLAFWGAAVVIGMSIVLWHLVLRKRIIKKKQDPWAGALPWRNHSRKNASQASSFSSHDVDEKHTMPNSAPLMSPSIRQRRTSATKLNRTWDSFLDTRGKPSHGPDGEGAISRLKSLAFGKQTKDKQPVGIMSAAAAASVANDKDWLSRFNPWKKPEQENAKNDEPVQRERPEKPTPLIIHTLRTTNTSPPSAMSLHAPLESGNPWGPPPQRSTTQNRVPPPRHPGGLNGRKKTLPSRPSENLAPRLPSPDRILTPQVIKPTTSPVAGPSGARPTARLDPNPFVDQNRVQARQANERNVAPASTSANPFITPFDDSNAITGSSRAGGGFR